MADVTVSRGIQREAKLFTSVLWTSVNRPRIDFRVFVGVRGWMVVHGGGWCMTVAGWWCMAVGGWMLGEGGVSELINSGTN